MPSPKKSTVLIRLQSLKAILLSKRVNVNMANIKGVTAFYFACSNGYIEVTELSGSQNTQRSKSEYHS
jgi:Ankyrin repeats (many copies)